MKLIDKITDFPGDSNEDRYFQNDRHMGVIDGATPLDNHPIAGYTSQAEWLADILAEQLTISTKPFQETIVNWVDETRDFVNQNIPNNLLQPSAVIGVAEQTRNRITLHLLGDVSISVLGRNGLISQYSDYRVEIFGGKTNQSKALGASLAEIKQQRVNNRRQMNRPGGYYTVSHDGSFRKQFISITIDPDLIDKILIYTDGFERVFKQTSIIPYQVLSGKISLKNAVKALREVENHSFHKQNTVVKKGDDATAVLIQI